MDKFRIKGPSMLSGEVRVSGSKNASLAVITAALLVPGRYVISNVPNLRDIRTIMTILNGLGAECSFASRSMRIDTRRIKSRKAPYELVKTMRASFYVMGPLLGRFGHGEVALPGGCAIGVRPIDLHLKGFEKLGAKIEIRKGFVTARAPRGGLKGTEIFLDKPSVGATVNLVMAAVTASGTTKIFNASVDPDMLDMVRFLQKMGARIDGAGTSILIIHGGKKLRAADYRVMPDRIEAGTFALAAAITKGRVTVKGHRNAHLKHLFTVFDKIGVPYSLEGSSSVTVRPWKKRPGSLDISTAPYPGFATDLQPQLTALLSLAGGTSVVNETIFENRFLHIPELNRMGANIQHDEHLAIINGVKRLNGAPVMASDLRNGSALVLAGLAARGTTTVDRIYHIDRGYENLEGKLSRLGADIKRIKEKSRT